MELTVYKTVMLTLEISQNGQTHFNNLAANAARLLKYV